jgi:hypothetical protein
VQVQVQEELYSTATARGMKGLGHWEQGHACGEAPSLYKSRAIWQRESLLFQMRVLCMVASGLQNRKCEWRRGFGGRAPGKLVLVSVANAWTPSHSQSPQLWTLINYFAAGSGAAAPQVAARLLRLSLFNPPFPPIAWGRGPWWSCPEGGSVLCGDWLLSRFSGAQPGGRRRGASFSLLMNGA